MDEDEEKENVFMKYAGATAGGAFGVSLGCGMALVYLFITGLTILGLVVAFRSSCLAGVVACFLPPVALIWGLIELFEFLF